MLCINIFQTRFLPITDEFTSSEASDFPKCGCKGTTISASLQIFQARITRITRKNDSFFKIFVKFVKFVPKKL